MTDVYVREHQPGQDGTNVRSRFVFPPYDSVPKSSAIGKGRATLMVNRWAKETRSANVGLAWSRQIQKYIAAMGTRDISRGDKSPLAGGAKPRSGNGAVTGQAA